MCSSLTSKAIAFEDRKAKRQRLLIEEEIELELELELIQTQMTQKPMLRAEVGMCPHLPGNLHQKTGLEKQEIGSQKS